MAITCETESRINFIRHPIHNKKDLTYIIGANCSDGIALIGDKRITIDGGADYSFTKKIFNPYASIVMAAAGTTGHFRSFRARFSQGLQKLKNSTEVPENAFEIREALIVMIEQTIQNMASDYSKQYIQLDLDVLMVSRFPFTSLYHFNRLGSPEPVTKYFAIGHGEPYGKILLKRLWKKTKPINMTQFAKIGCLIIKYIQDCELDNSVGYNDENLPQVVFIPKILTNVDDEKKLPEFYDKFPIKELTNSEVVELMKNFDEHISNIKKSIDSISL